MLSSPRLSKWLRRATRVFGSSWDVVRHGQVPAHRGRWHAMRSNCRTLCLKRRDSHILVRSASVVVGITSYCPLLCGIDKSLSSLFLGQHLPMAYWAIDPPVIRSATSRAMIDRDRFPDHGSHNHRCTGRLQQDQVAATLLCSSCGHPGCSLLHRSTPLCWRYCNSRLWRSRSRSWFSHHCRLGSLLRRSSRRRRFRLASRVDG